MEVVRARLQEAECKYSGSRDCVQRIVRWADTNLVTILYFSNCRYEGMTGLYKGFTPYTVHVMPNICLVFLIYECMVNKS